MTELFRVPVAQVRQLQPIYLTVSYQAETLASVKAYSAGKTSLRTAFNGTGFVTVCKYFILPPPITDVARVLKGRRKENEKRKYDAVVVDNFGYLCHFIIRHA